MTAPISVSEEQFEAEVLQSDKPVLVDFWAPWCAPCRMVAPIVEELADEMEGKLKVAKVNVDDNIGLAERYGVRSIPSLLIFKDGKVARTIIGYRPKKEMENEIAQVIAT